MHTEMSFLSQAFKEHMKDENNMTDECYLSKLKARVGQDGLLHPEKNKIVKNDSSYERHKQFYMGVGRMFGLNMFSNYDKLHPEKLDAVKTKAQALEYILDIFAEYGITDNLFFNPAIHDPDQMEASEAKAGEDDLFIYARDVLVRYLLLVAFDYIEKYGDAKGWLSLRLTLILAFLGNNLKVQASKYATSTLFDVVLQLSSSPLMQERMQKHMVINRSGRRGGGVFMDKFTEWGVKKVKGKLAGLHCKADAILLEKELCSLNLLSIVCDHDQDSMLRTDHGKQGSNDFLKEHGRNILEEQVVQGDPFNRQRSVKHKFRKSPRGSPYTGLKEKEVERFLLRKSEDYEVKY